MDILADSDLNGGPSSPLLSPPVLRFWRILQGIVWLIGVLIFLALLFWPPLGIHAFWNVLIPVAPALVAIAPGLWRNVCPLGSTALFARHMNWSSGERLSPIWQGRLALIGVSLLLLIVPLRHVVLDTSGAATGLTIAVLAVLAVVVCFRHRWKSAWCSGMCPVHPVEKLYGSEPIATFPNTHCHRCERCVAECPDSIAGVSPLLPINNKGLRHLAGILMVGGFVGFLWGWFHVQDYTGSEGWQHLVQAYALPFAGLAVTLSLFLLLQSITPPQHTQTLHRLFAASAISCYYWYRFPALFGFGPFPGDGMLIDLRGTLPEWWPVISRSVTTSFFLWWLVVRRSSGRTWLTRPPFATRALASAAAAAQH